MRAMLIIASFKHSLYLELALVHLEQGGIAKHDMLVAPLDKQASPKRQSDMAIVHKDGHSQVDKAFIAATVCMLLGAIYGFVLAWGPILWALFGFVGGGCIGLATDVLVRKKPSPQHGKDASEVVLLLQCAPEQTEAVESILWNHQALGVSKIDSYPASPT
jgi:hypothetical protein